MGQGSARPVTSKQSHDGQSQSLQLRWGCSSMQGWRPYMEDFHFAMHSLGGDWSDTAAFGVLDGHGGREVALFCQQRLPTAIGKMNRWRLTELETKVSNLLGGSVDDMPTGHTRQNAASAAAAGRALVAALEGMDQLLEEEAEYLRSLRILTGDARDQQMGASRVGCTACVCLVQESSIIVANVGDSRVVLCQNGLAIPLSTDHKPNLPSERERIVRAGGTVDQQDFGGLTVYRVNGNLNLSRSLGDLDYKRHAKLAARDQVITSFPDLIEKKRERHDEFLLIASDGIWDRISNQDAVDMVLERLAGNEEARLSSITEALVERCFSPDLAESGGLGGDNMTALLVLLGMGGQSPRSGCSDRSDLTHGGDLAHERVEQSTKLGLFQGGFLCSCSAVPRFSL